MCDLPLAMTPDDYGFHQLAMIRDDFLQHLAASQLAPENLLKNAGKYSEVTHWEELICAAIDPDGGRLMALVGVHQANGYSGMFRSHGSIEYVRFFIDWEDGEGYQSLSLGHFKVCDQPSDMDACHRSRYWQVSTSFDKERYWGCMLNGVRPKMKAVLSWHRVPELDHTYSPLFGNAIESSACVTSDKALFRLAADEAQRPHGEMPGVMRTDFSVVAGVFG